MVYAVGRNTPASQNNTGIDAEKTTASSLLAFRYIHPVGSGTTATNSARHRQQFSALGNGCNCTLETTEHTARYLSYSWHPRSNISLPVHALPSYHKRGRSFYGSRQGSGSNPYSSGRTGLKKQVIQYYFFTHVIFKSCGFHVICNPIYGS